MLLKIYNLLFDNGYLAIVGYRISNYLWSKGINFLLLPKLIMHITTKLTTVQIHFKAKIGKIFIIAHGFGVVIGYGAVIGDNVVIFNDVTIGAKRPYKSRDISDDEEFPCIGNNVVIYAGAKLIGCVNVGDNAIIGANSVVLKDIPADATVCGAPAEIINYHIEKPNKIKASTL